jgi:hypothetical protein
MSGPHRFEPEQRLTSVKRRRIAILLLVGFVAVGIVISLAFAHHGWPLE